MPVSTHMYMCAYVQSLAYTDVKQTCIYAKALHLYRRDFRIFRIVISLSFAYTQISRVYMHISFAYRICNPCQSLHTYIYIYMCVYVGLFGIHASLFCIYAGFFYIYVIPFYLGQFRQIVTYMWVSFADV